ncbi:MAG: hypothetical protein N3E40_00145 [Dehalococcoidia bacterium]|nr:hypothetical protein [Dehalococcoidia bacterium]
MVGSYFNGNAVAFRFFLLGLFFVASVAGFLATSTFWELKSSIKEVQTELKLLCQSVQRHEMLLRLSDNERQKFIEREKSH